jgi:ABC-type antimicrobial peptide transport system permease subunit
MLGVIIGVGAVIAMMGIGQGADQQVQSQLANLGSKPSLCQLRFHEPRRPEIRVGSYKDAGAG